MKTFEGETSGYRRLPHPLLWELLKIIVPRKFCDRIYMYRLLPRDKEGSQNIIRGQVIIFWRMFESQDITYLYPIVHGDRTGTGLEEQTFSCCIR